MCLLLLAGCYSPHISTGAPCGPGEPCPLPLVCAANTCELTAIDAPIGDDAAVADVSADTRSDDAASDATACFGTGLVTVCFTTPPAGAQTLPATIDTDVEAQCTLVTATDPALCVIAATAIDVISTVATGKRPLVLIGTTSITISGTLDVSSHVGGTVGPAADAPQCTTATAAIMPGGGAGGSFAVRGGNGGMGLPAGIGGNAGQSIPNITKVHGGCPGGGGSAGTPGHGGGALYLIAPQLTVAGTIDASGAGGGGCTGSCGGGGGGTGGFIGIDAQQASVLPSAMIFANGGGGGEGAASSTGDNGSDPVSALSAASGGTGGTMNGGDGGAGGFVNGNPGSGGNGGGTTGGGGGGGGAIGIIKLYGGLLTLGGMVSPRPTL